MCVCVCMSNYVYIFWRMTIRALPVQVFFIRSRETSKGIDNWSPRSPRLTHKCTTAHDNTHVI